MQLPSLDLKRTMCSIPTTGVYQSTPPFSKCRPIADRSTTVRDPSKQQSPTSATPPPPPPPGPPPLALSFKTAMVSSEQQVTANGTPPPFPFPLVLRCGLPELERAVPPSPNATEAGSGTGGSSPSFRRITVTSLFCSLGQTQAGHANTGKRR